MFIRILRVFVLYKIVFTRCWVEGDHFKSALIEHLGYSLRTPLINDDSIYDMKRI